MHILVLQKLVNKNTLSWEAIAAKFEGRTKNQCRKKWKQMKSKKENIKWSEEDDNLLKSLV